MSGRTKLPPPPIKTLDQMAKEHIVKAMIHYRGNLTHVAKALGISITTLYRRLDWYNIPRR